ncbi:uracil-DNA glycosylase [endosymbiont of Euscepes postfasciatus]|uniref:uracil-DNA glycosylase n=1 Tax=endosymbiont of Euscepes postfasciatus TaxID=650377 RepID=UPI000DC71C96|nr:uracil-DNA glycosylase [endosymbiont of Euscepes postfasciatus]BBA84744.1 uracil-DNA glycosylase [endosymbiont of Euscepes postfasciatus]
MKITWNKIFKIEKEKKYFKKIKKYIYISKKNKKIIYPNNEDIFNAFKLTKFNNIKIVIIGQDPYYKKNQANGLSFSVNKNIMIPPSLKNIYTELKRDLNNFKYPNHGYLKKWSTQGILLLNLILTVEEKKPLSHEFIGWKIFTKRIINIINIYKSNIIFLLWGNYVKNNILNIINKKKHYILQTSHPSPLSFRNGFYGCSHFSKVNNILKYNKKKIIDWQI